MTYVHKTLCSKSPLEVNFVWSQNLTRFGRPVDNYVTLTPPQNAHCANRYLEI